MDYRLNTIFEQKSYTADATEIIDIDAQDPISQIIVGLDVVNDGDTSTAHAIACLTKIELVDGSDKLFSLSGYEAEAVDWYHNLVLRPNWNPYLNGMSVQRFIGINFGRWLWDEMLAFDPKQFRNPQLKLTLDIDAGGNSASTNKLKVWAAMFDEKTINPVGFLMHKEVKSYIMTASGHEYTDMPLDYPYRKLLIRQQEAGTEPNQNVANIKVSENQDKKVPFDHGTEDILRAITARTPMLSEVLYFPITITSGNRYCTPTTRVVGNINEWAAAIAAGAMGFYDGDGGRFKAICATGPTNANAMVSGWLPHGVWDIPCQSKDEPGGYYDVTRLRSLKLDVTGAAGLAGTETLQIFLQQYRPY